MLLSAVIFLKAVRDGRYSHFTGRGTHGFWLKSWRAVDPPVGDWLHAGQWDTPFDPAGHPAPAAAAPAERGERSAPYAVSPLMGLPEPENGWQHIPAGWNAWLRVSSLHPELSRRMTHGPRAWLANLPERLSIDGLEWVVAGQTLDPAVHPWASSSSYEALRCAALDGAAAPRRWTVQFETPMLIRGANLEGQVTSLLFPLPDRLLDGWRRGWNAYAGLENPREPLVIAPELAAQARETLRAVGFTLQTRTVTYQYQSPHSSKPRVEVPTTGCVGQVTYASIDNPAVRAVEDLLFQYGFYRGSGYHTTQRLGQTRLLPACDAGGG